MVLVEKICFRLREETNQTEIGQFLNDTQSMEIYRQNHFSRTEFIFFLNLFHYWNYSGNMLLNNKSCKQPLKGVVAVPEKTACSKGIG